MKKFDEILERIKEATNIKNMVHLAKTIGTVQSNVSKKRKEDKFPVEWAYIVGREYRLLTEWIMTGEGPKRLNEIKTREIKLISKIEEWIKETEKKEPGALNWFKFDFRKKYPEFDRWEKREENNLSKRISAG